MFKKAAHRALKATMAALLMAPLFTGLAPSAAADDRVGRNNFCRASGHSTVTCNFQDDDDDDGDGNKKEFINIDIDVLNDVNVDTNIENITLLEDGINIVVSDTVKSCTVTKMTNSACAGLIAVNVANLLNTNLIGWKKTCADKDGEYACKSS